MRSCHAFVTPLLALSLALVVGACGGAPSLDETTASSEQPFSSVRKPFDPGHAPPLEVAPASMEKEALDLRIRTEAGDSPSLMSAFSYSASNTNSATINTADTYFNLSAGQTITLGTCGLPGASGSGDTYLRFYNPSGMQVAFNDDSCGLLSNFSYSIPTSGTYRLSAGCYSSGSCSGTVAYTIDAAVVTIPSAGLKMWLRADSGVVQSGGRVSSWQDQSGNGNHATMASAPRQPYYVTSALNGKPVIRFNGAESLYFTSVLRMSQSTVFVVAKNSLATESFSMILGPGGNSANHQLRFENGSSALLVTPNIYASPIGNTRVYLALSTRYDGSTWSVFRDGVLKSTHGSSPGAWELNQVGAWFSSYFMVGDIAEVIAYDRALSESERTMVNSYLRGKYLLP